jgi:hypothetical protein
MKLFKNRPGNPRQREYERLMKQAMEAQRGGDIVRSAELHQQAEALRKQMNQDSSPTP